MEIIIDECFMFYYSLYNNVVVMAKITKENQVSPSLKKIVNNLELLGYAIIFPPIVIRNNCKKDMS